MRCHRPLIVTTIISAGALALLAAGCGGGGASPGVASIASSTDTVSTTTTTTTQGGSGSGDKLNAAPAGGTGQFSIAINTGNAALGAKFSSCMRKHGVTNFPDPNGQGVIQFGSGLGIDPNSPTFRTARSACQSLLPNGGQPTAQQRAAAQQHLLAFSNCMRAHGIKDFPDPSSGGLKIRLGQAGSDLDPNNPHFQSAQQACQGNLPFKGLKVGGTSSGGSK
jgi:hypothetical protein